LIALTLIGTLLTFLFSFFVESVKLEKKLETARMAISNRGHLQTRLQNVLSSIDRGSDGILYTQVLDKSMSLLVLFDNGIDPDPSYSGTLLGRIFLDEEKNLCLASWPNGKEKKLPWRKEILMPKVKSFAFEFLGKSAPLAWRSEWPKSQTTLPLLIRLHVVEEKDALRFAFILPSPDSFVSYDGRKAS
jgi:hypothetical protein